MSVVLTYIHSWVGAWNKKTSSILTKQDWIEICRIFTSADNESLIHPSPQYGGIDRQIRREKLSTILLISQRSWTHLNMSWAVLFYVLMSSFSVSSLLVNSSHHDVARWNISSYSSKSSIISTWIISTYSSKSSMLDRSSSWLATAKRVVEEGMAHCHLAIYSKVATKIILQSWA